MKVVQVELSEQMAVELEEMVNRGWFRDESEIVRLAVIEFVRNNRFALMEQFQLEDIAWARQLHRNAE